ncbi:MAG: hypothetical protein A2808_03145 [Candidatus Moranbacteria bacterium RIFCSPHIGHO2_01_FULL_55_24]|nr:MAG: hypothetical protein A2808_03145 [Candidatus Moranbacteria bacterium RIFCSPHIGHO2_01_FULL_55_24]
MRYTMSIMNLPSFDMKSDIPFVLFGMIFLVFGWVVFVLALFGLFSSPLIVSIALFAALAALFFGWKYLSRTSSDRRLVFVLSLLYAFLIAWSATTPTLFSGRDQGSISEAAIRLSQNGELAWNTPATDAFFRIYGPGTALNFPGFIYTESGYLITQFPVAYTAWLASFMTLFGILGLLAANALLVFLSLITLYQILRLSLSSGYALLGLGLGAFSFLLAWFPKFTLTENFALFLFLSLVLSHILLFREGKFVSYASALLSATLFAFTRIEGFAFLGVTLLLFAANPKTRAIWKSYPVKSLLLPGAIFSFIFLRNFFINLPYYKVIGKALFKFLHGFGNDIIANGTPFAGLVTAYPLGSVFILYGLLGIFIAGLFGILVLIRKKSYEQLIPVALALPTFLYLFSPNITLDHPWMLRRYLFSLFPALLLTAVFAFAAILESKRAAAPGGPALKKVFNPLFVLFCIILLALQFPSWRLAMTSRENPELLPQVEAFASQFTEEDLVLVDRFATGNGYAMLTGPGNALFKKNTVYFFNPEDLAKLDTSRFSRIYLLTPNENLPRYASVFGDKMIYRGEYTFKTSGLEPENLSEVSSISLPEVTTKETKNLLFQLY